MNLQHYGKTYKTDFGIQVNRYGSIYVTVSRLDAGFHLNPRWWRRFTYESGWLTVGPFYIVWT